MPAFPSRLFLTACVLSATPPAVAQYDAANQTVRFRGKTYQIYPPDKLRARGGHVPDIPADQNAAWLYIDAMNALVDLPEDLNEALDSATSGQWPEGDAGAKLADWINQNNSAIELARRASAMPQHHMPMFRGDTDMLIGAVLPTLGHQRQIAKILAADSARALSQGESDQAAENCLVMQRMANQVGHGETLIQGLVGYAIGGLSSQTLQRVAESPHATAETLSTTVSELEALAPSFPDWEHMTRSEQLWGGSYIDDAIELSGTRGLLNFNLSQESVSPESEGWHKLIVRLRKLYLPDRTMKRHYASHFDRMVAAAKRDDGMARSDEALMAQIPAWDVTVRMLAPALSRTYESSLMARSNFERTRVRLAVEAHKRKHGTAPASLNVLSGDLLRSVPLDPMTGRELEYAVASDGKSYSGLDPATREAVQKIREARVPPAAPDDRASEWRRTVDAIADQYGFTPAQRASADAILKDLEARAIGIEAAQKATKSDAQPKAMNELSAELQRRLLELPTQAQRAAAKEDKRS